MSLIHKEVIHFMRSKQKNRKWIVVKINLEKAYDRVCWEFIEASLKATCIPDLFNNIIMSAISNSSMQILYNGVLFPKFKLVRGIRHRCPLSPYLFVMCMEWLGHNMHSTIQREFYNFSRHRVNVRKSYIFLSKGVSEEIMKILSDILGFNREQNLESYLGIPILHERVINSTLRFVVDRVCTKLHSWEARKLSLVGRANFAQFILLTIPSYFMQSMRIPTGLCDEIEQLARQFIWGASKRERKIALVGHWSENLLWSVGDGSLINCWSDPWIPKFGHLLNHIPSRSNMERENMLSSMVSEDVVRRIMGIPPPQLEVDPDRITWAGSSKGYFSIKSAFWKIREETWNPKNDIWKLPWKIQSPQRDWISANLQNHLNLHLDGINWQYFFGMVNISNCQVPTVAVPKIGNWIQLNFDGAVKEESKFAIIRGGGWIIGYNRGVGICSVLDSKLWGILEGLTIAMDKGFNRVLIDFDSHEAGSTTKVSNSNLVRRINLRVAKLSQWSIQHISRDFNKKADSLTKIDVDNKSSTQFFEMPPRRLGCIYE
ncbi:LINE-type retrotransposon LIb DNA, Insertion at the S11 site-like protein [Gossypium australe]|uniref:LINE-type retrotransposon LIb DNA, Insertion at the S11 site-like protein n=1 Tax=Gossypium australe TaxID=47621 RepID=A0A5B6X4B5_9ROSI|nr:LINE-type retrotransposon LIb DNA, Insertion at the S11 site-like protein [Gossypium australe]